MGALAVHPVANLVLHLRLQQVEMVGVADFDILAAGDRGIRVNQVDRVQEPSAIVALVAARLFEATGRAGALDVAVGQEAAIIDRIDLFGCALFDQAVLFQDLREMLGQCAVGRAGGASKPVIGQVETLACGALYLVLLVAIGLDAHLGGLGSQFSWRAMLVCGADIGHVVAHQSHHAGIYIRRQHGACQITEMLDAVDIRQGGRNENAPGLRHGDAVFPK